MAAKKKKADTPSAAEATVMESVDRINPAPYNPRVALEPGMEEYEQLKSSLTRWGMVEPLVVNRRNDVLVSGHQRLAVMKDMGFKEVPVVWVDLEDDAERRLNLALNRVKGRWDSAKLLEVLRDVSVLSDDESRDELLFSSGFKASDVAQVLSNDEVQSALAAIDEMTSTIDEQEARRKAAEITRIREDSGGEKISEEDHEGPARDWFSLSFPMEREERDEVNAALKSVRERIGAASPAMALVEMCRRWVSEEAERIGV